MKELTTDARLGTSAENKGTLNLGDAGAVSGIDGTGTPMTRPMEMPSPPTSLNPAPTAAAARRRLDRYSITERDAWSTTT